MKSFSLSEISKHNSSDSCYVIIHNTVYDVTSYIYSHPGGSNLILKGAGGDITGDFEGMFHSRKARDILERYAIGYVEGRENQIRGTVGGRLIAWRSLNGGKSGSMYSSQFVNGKQDGVTDQSTDDMEDEPQLGSYEEYIRNLSMRSQNSKVEKAPIPYGMPQAYQNDSRTKVMYPQIYQKYQLINRVRCEGNNVYVLKFKLPRPNSRLLCPLGYHIQVRVKLNVNFVKNISNTNQDILNEKIYKQNTTLDNVNHEIEYVEETIPLSLTSTSSSLIHSPEKENIQERKYTPTNVSENGSFELIVKCYPNDPVINSVSYYLCHQLQYHEEIEMKGPFGIYQYQPNKTNYLGIIVGGSGITPVIRIIESILSNRKIDKTKIILLYANRTEEDIILYTKLNEWAMKDAPNFKIIHVLSKPNQKMPPEVMIPEITSAAWNNDLIGHISTEIALKYFLPKFMQKPDYIPNRRDFYALICGSDDFVKKSLQICNDLKLNTQSQVHVF